jgi:hypothetical protein
VKCVGDVGGYRYLVTVVHPLEKVEHSIELIQLPQQLRTLDQHAAGVEALKEPRFSASATLRKDAGVAQMAERLLCKQVACVNRLTANVVGGRDLPAR